MRHVLIVSVLAASLLAACNRQDQAPASVEATPAAASTMATPASAEVTAVPQAVISKTDALWAEPSSLDCGKPGKVTLHWNARHFQGVSRVEVFVISPAGQEKKFIASGHVGSAETGGWVRKGIQFSLRNKEDGAELAKIAVDGSACGNGATHTGSSDAPAAVLPQVATPDDASAGTPSGHD